MGADQSPADPMKRRWATVWTVTYDGGTTVWWGTCPWWAAQPLPAGATLTRHRVLTVGAKRLPCDFHGCTGSHLVITKPDALTRHVDLVAR